MLFRRFRRDFIARACRILFCFRVVEAGVSRVIAMGQMRFAYRGFRVLVLPTVVVLICMFARRGDWLLFELLDGLSV